ncbi:ABC transporter ATP-binding protein [Paenibacillus pinisoli]|uniref:Carnitine transport ATP-binding protein OpuCA n=1 Tax=Paenibacillus pinisoli TaxID=1276110 RepID=A0A3A6PTL6_9BACL|nr:ABC transporter ATP-binding protein [Paenibacillus pinisoli]RJX41629.1 ABC transporter ATP-binding protein [Paenibacillus pinisoli]
MSFVSIHALSYSYPGTAAAVLNDFSLDLEQGEVVGLLGQSGSGKSTLLRLIAGLEAPSQGEISIQGETMSSRHKFVQPERRGVGMVFQDYALFPHMNVSRNIAFGLRGLSRNERKNRVTDMLELVKLADYGHRYPHELSGGQQQRVAFARALAPSPRLLLMDEPFSNLDSELKNGIRKELKELLHQTGITSILVTHDHEDAEALCDRIIRMTSFMPELQAGKKHQLVTS